MDDVTEAALSIADKQVEKVMDLRTELVLKMEDLSIDYVSELTEQQSADLRVRITTTEANVKTWLRSTS